MRHEKIKKLHDIISPYYALIIMLIFIWGLFVGLYKIIIKSDDLLVNVERSEMNYPSSINRQYNEIYKAYIDSSEVLSKNLIEVRQYLINTNSYIKIDLINNKKNTIREVKFKMLGVDEMTSWAISSDFLADKEKDQFLKNIDYDDNSNMVYFKQGYDIPANSKLSLFIWGNFRLNPFVKDIMVSHSEGDGFINEVKKVSGIKGYLINYYLEILIIIFILFIIVYNYGINNNKVDDSTA